MKTTNFFKRQKSTKQKNAETADIINECKNCGTSFKGNYCPNCGQSTKEYDRPFSVLIYDFMGTMFAFDTRFLKTLIALITSPGHYSSEFVKGKRASYMQPFKFYVFVSFVFFLLLHLKTGEFISANSDANPTAITTPISAKDSADVNSAHAIIEKSLSTAKERLNHPMKTAEMAKKLDKTGTGKNLDKDEINQVRSALLLATDKKTADSLTRKIQNKIAEENANKKASADSSGVTLSKTERDKVFTTKNIKKVQYYLLKAYNKPNTSPFAKRLLGNTIRLMDFPQVFVTRALQYFSWSLFVLVPFFAFWLWLFFHKTRSFYFDHLVYSLASVSTTFLILSIILAIKLIFPNKLSAPENYLLWLIPIYIWLGMKKYYKRSVIGTTFKFFVLSAIYWFSSLMAGLVVFFLSIYF